MKLFKKRYKCHHMTDDGSWIKLYYKPFEYQLERLKCKINSWSFERDINKQIKKGYLGKDLEPLKCPFCDCEKIETYETFYSDGNYILEEYWVRCAECKKHVGTWSYGGWSL